MMRASSIGSTGASSTAGSSMAITSVRCINPIVQPVSS